MPFGKGKIPFDLAVRNIAAANYAGIGYCAGKLGITREKLHSYMCGREHIDDPIMSRTSELLVSTFIG